MMQNEISVFDFKKGDIITRIKPSKTIPGLEDIKDRAFIGQRLRFLGIANGCVYVEIAENDDLDDETPGIGRFFKLLSEKAGPVNLPLDIWEDGWSYYIDPYSIGDDDSNIMSEKELTKGIESAIEKEDYKLAEQLKKKLNNLKK